MGTRHERLRMAGSVSARVPLAVGRSARRRHILLFCFGHQGPVAQVGQRHEFQSSPRLHGGCSLFGSRGTRPRHLLLGVVLLIPTPALLQGSAWDSGLTTSAWPSWAAVMGLSVALQPRARIRDGRKLVLGPWREMALVSAGTWDLSRRPEASDHHAEPAMMTRT